MRNNKFSRNRLLDHIKGTSTIRNFNDLHKFFKEMKNSAEMEWKI